MNSGKPHGLDTAEALHAIVPVIQTAPTPEATTVGVLLASLVAMLVKWAPLLGTVAQNVGYFAVHAAAVQLACDETANTASMTSGLLE